jgi:hypothetical protein
VRDPMAALERAIELAGPADAVFATGSLYLVGDLRAYWSKRAVLVPAADVAEHRSTRRPKSR